jgi:hypothetical protein
VRLVGVLGGTQVRGPGKKDVRQGEHGRKLSMAPVASWRVEVL